jgi:hypothetical protein
VSSATTASAACAMARPYVTHLIEDGWDALLVQQLPQ